MSVSSIWIYSASTFLAKKSPSKRYSCQAVSNHPRSTLQMKSSRISYREGSQVFED